MPILFLIVFINLVGFGILIPLIPFYALRLGASPMEITLAVMAIYSFVQFVTSPILGRISDRFGRKPVLAITLAGTAISYLLLTVADSLLFLFFARAFAGLNAGNLGTAYAYVADITTPKDRAKGLGMLGAAFGLGFIFGPAIGGFLAGETVEGANYVLPALASACLSGIACLAVIFFLPESLKTEIREKLKSRPQLSLKTKLQTALGRQSLVMLIVTSFLFITAWALFETIYGLWSYETFDFGPISIAVTLTYVGFVGVIVQGGLIGPLTKRFGEKNLGFVGLVFVGIGFLGLANAVSIIHILGALTFMAAGSGLINPSLSSLVSKEADETEQGAVMGIYQGAGSLARVVGPTISGTIYQSFGFSAPYLLGAILVMPCLLILLRYANNQKQTVTEEP